MNVSFAVAGVVGAVGIASLKKVREKKEYAIALVPLIFCVQQIIEGLIWYFLNGGGMVAPCFTNGYSFFAYAFWPIYIPIAVALIEPDVYRKRFIAMCGFLGALTSFDMLYSIVFYGVTVSVVQGSLFYTIPVASRLLVQVFYLMGVCVSMLTSSHRWIQRLGFSVSVALFVTYIWYSYVFHSLWCFCAAILSTLVYFHLSSRQVFIHRA